MIQMEYDGRIAYLFGFDSQVEHPFSELPVLSAIMHFFVKSIDGEYIFSPSGGVATVPCGFGRGDGVHKTRKSLILNKLGTFEVAFHVLFFQPGERESILTLYIVISKLFADIHRQFEVASR